MDEQSEFVFDFESEYQSDNEVSEDGRNPAALYEHVTDVVITGEEVNTLIPESSNVEITLMKYITKGTDSVVTKKVHEPLQSMGSVSVVGSSIGIRKMSWFMRAVQIASNFEIHPNTDGTVCMTFTFHGLTSPLE